MSPFTFLPATADEVPILISVPHCGTEFPDELKSDYHPGLMAMPDDTDWFVNDLYDFAPALGMPMITACYSRWVVDLNRDPHNKPLYDDGRIITALCPVTTFSGDPLYLDNRSEVSTAETGRRRDRYFWPYHQKIQEELERLKKKFGAVLLWDCHSIRQFVPSVHPARFPDLILGDNDGKAAGDELIKLAFSGLRSGRYSVSHNTPFKGGFITRCYGQPEQRQHALQLEMTKVNYMDRAEVNYDAGRAEEMRSLLDQLLTSLARTLIN